ncbi:MAG: cytochrome P450 [Myxococcaceae bacterium]|nr:cytochrome P450 [Myxococcaceae bacterium]
MSLRDSLGAAPEVIRLGVNGYMQSALALKGEVVAASLGPLPAIFVSHPDLIRHILIQNKSNYLKDNALFAYLRPLAGNGLFLSDGEFWRSQRRIMQPEFTRHGVDALVDEMSKVADTIAAEWDLERRRGQVVDATESMRTAAMRIITQTVLDADVGHDAARLGQALDRFLLLFQAQLSVPSPLGGLATRLVNRPMTWCIETIDRFIADVIAKNQARGTAGVVNRLLAAPDPDTGRSMSVSHLRDEIMTLFIAGHETTANTLAWAWVELCRQPELLRQLQAEVDGVLGGRPPRASDLPQLAFARAVFEEAMRLYPPVPFAPRQAAADDVLGGHRVPAGALVLTSFFALHRRAELWPEPLRFDPGRFMPERRKGLPPGAYAPFGAGPRTCLGNHFAIAEGQVLLATLAQRFDVELASTERIGISRLPGSLRPDQPVMLRLSAR